jgi:hypothetical protein
MACVAKLKFPSADGEARSAPPGVHDTNRGCRTRPGLHCRRPLLDRGKRRPIALPVVGPTLVATPVCAPRPPVGRPEGGVPRKRSPQKAELSGVPRVAPPSRCAYPFRLTDAGGVLPGTSGCVRMNATPTPAKPACSDALQRQVTNRKYSPGYTLEAKGDRVPSRSGAPQ